jgi:hypothetical protein
MTLLAKARQNRRIALAVRAALRGRTPAAAPVFRSRREAANIDRAPGAALRAA